MTNLTCTQCREHLSSCLDAELDAQTQSAVDAHLAECEACREQLERELAFEDAARGKLDEERMPDEMWQSLSAEIRSEPHVVKFPIPWPAALAASILLVAAGALFYSDRGGPAGPDEAMPAITVSQSVGDLLHEATPQLVAFKSTDAPDVATRISNVTRDLLGATVTFDTKASHHKIELIDVNRMTDASGKDYVEIRLNCCGKPVLLALAKADCKSCICELRRETGLCDRKACKKGKGNCTGPSECCVKMQSQNRGGVMVAYAAADHDPSGEWAALHIEPSNAG